MDHVDHAAAARRRARRTGDLGEGAAGPPAGSHPGARPEARLEAQTEALLGAHPGAQPGNRPDRRRSRRRPRTLLATPAVALLALAAALGVLPHQGLPPAHGDENMGICIVPATTSPVLPPAPGTGATKVLPLGAAMLFDPGCGDPLGQPESPKPGAQFDTAGVSNTVTHVATGSYAVRFGGLGAGAGVPQVTAVGAAPDRCRIGGWRPDGYDELVTVLCADVQGKAVDWEFTASYTTERPTAQTFGYLSADQPADAQVYQPASQYTSSGTPATVQRTAVGHYTVTRAEPGNAPGADLVTAAGTGDGRTFCKLAASTAATVSVACFAGPAPVDAPFTLVYAAKGNLLGLPDAAQGAGFPPSAYAWADPSTGPVPDPARRFASNDPGTGWSQSFDKVARLTHVAMPVPMSSGVAQLAAAGPDASFCAVAGDWTGGSVPVGCWDAGGTPVQEAADVVFTGLP